MGRVIPTWPDFTVIEVPRRFLRSEQDVLVATTRIGEGPPIVVAVPVALTARYSQEWYGVDVDAEVDRLIRKGVESCRLPQQT